MGNTIYREKSIKKVSSPEQLDDFIKVSNPSVWIILSAIIVFLLGVCIWGIFGRIETKTPLAMQVEKGQVVYYVSADNYSIIQKSSVEKDEKIYNYINDFSIVEEELSSAILNICEAEIKDIVYKIETQISSDKKDGVYEYDILTESITPMSLLFN